MKISADRFVSDVGLALARGDAALWFGPTWKAPQSAEEIALLTKPSWLGVWAEPTDSEFADALGAQWRDRAGVRLIVEVPDRIDEVLGSHFSMAEICPYFYLNGRISDSGHLSAFGRRRMRDRKVECLKRLGASVLVIAGYRDVDECRSAIVDEIHEAAPGLRLLALTDIAEPEQEQLLSSLPAELVARVCASSLSLVELLGKVELQKHALPSEPTVRVGSESVPLLRLLRTEPPIDQDFVILTERDVRNPEADEKEQELFGDLLSGRQPAWRAFAHDLAWQRSSELRGHVEREIAKVRGGDGAQVVCLNVPAEIGAGTTVLLQQIAFDAARAGHPTLLHRSVASEFNYDLLRTFLTDLYRGLGPESSLVPAVLIFDTSSVEADTQGALRDLPVRLVQDGRHVVMVRAVRIRRADEVQADFRGLHGVRTRPRVRQDWLAPLKATLTPTEQDALAEWAARRFASLGLNLPAKSLELIRSWDRTQADVPLLIWLYFVLTEDFVATAALGRHIVDRLRTLLPPPPSDRLQGAEISATRPLSRSELQAAFARAQEALGPHFARDLQPNSDDMAAAFVMLATLGYLRVAPPPDVLADITNVSLTEILNVIAAFEKQDLVNSTLPPDVTKGPRSQSGERQAPSAFYVEPNRIGLRHPTYGRLVLQWLMKDEASEDRRLLSANGVTETVLAALSDAGVDEEYPLALLKPVLQALKPTPVDVRFAAELSTRYLRLQRRDRTSNLSQAQWQNADLLRDAYSWMPEPVVRQSPVILHSRGITTYKTCRRDLPLEICRGRYRDAEQDFERAIELASRLGDQPGSEHPVNITTSLGLMYQGWASREREVGRTTDANDLDAKAESTLRTALKGRHGNVFAAFGLARFLINKYHRVQEEGTAPSPEYYAQTGRTLVEAIELLQAEPESYFADEWDELRRESCQLLDEPHAGRLIADLKANMDELGYALDALRLLGGQVPTMPTEDVESVRKMNAASTVLQVAERLGGVKHCNIASLLRYTLFTADPERLRKPAYRTRFDLLSQLLGSLYLEQSIWLFDYAMLAFQVGRYPEGADAYSKLRRGKKFFDVPLERSRVLASSPDSLAPMLVTLRISNISSGDERGWGRVEQPVRFRDPIPLNARDFRKRGKSTAVGSVVTCHVNLRPSGPLAEPDVR